MNSPLMYICDYDLPDDERRHHFNRAVSRYRKEYELEKEGRSTGSVIYTDNLDFAWFVYREALNVGGTAHVYRAERLD